MAFRLPGNEKSTKSFDFVSEVVYSSTFENFPMFRLEEYDYELPGELIAQVPAPKRDHSRLLLLNRQTKVTEDSYFFNLPDLLNPGDTLVVNDTRVIPARLQGRKESGGRVEILVLNQEGSGRKNDCVRLCLYKASKRARAGGVLFFERGVTGKILRLLDDGKVLIHFEGTDSVVDLLREKGRMPVPPYIKRLDNSHWRIDRDRYQTVYSRKEGAVAAPTAGLHFTDDLLKKLEKKGIVVVSVTLHVGYGTFQPVRVFDIRDHRVEAEYYKVEEHAARIIQECKDSGRRVIAVGTTAVRALETAALAKGKVDPGEGMTDLMVTPGFSFQVVDGLITNFHLPRSSLLFLVAAFAGRDVIREVYASAIRKKYRFYSYGDAMLIL